MKAEFVSQVEQRLNTAKTVAFDAGKLLMRHWGNLSGYDHKGKVNLVSAADRESEALVTVAIVNRYPDDAILGEETGERPGTSGFRWVIDPLDGTTNFVHSHPTFAVCIALEYAQKTVAGVVYLPATRELFFARQDGGAFGPGGPIACSATSDLDLSLLGTGLPYRRREILDILMEDWRRAISSAQGLRRMGAAAVDLVYLACGRTDGYWERELKPWDTAAGTIIVEEAGGVVTDFSGGPYSPYEDEIAASNGHIHAQLLKSLFGDR
jgi:myo-inositol-1(or 4)-monophosphatase